MLLFLHYYDSAQHLQFFGITLVIVATFVVVILIIVWILHGRVIRPILLGAKILEEIVDGNSQYRWQVPYQNELKLMAQIFNQILTHDLKQQLSLEKQVQKTHQLLQVTQNMQQEIQKNERLQQKLVLDKSLLQSKMSSATQRLQAVYNTLRDKTKEYIDTQQELQRAKQEANIANQRKNEIIATVSHELRSPLSASITLTDMLLQTNLTSDQHHHLLIIKDNNRHLLQVIGDILDLAQIETGHLKFNPVDFDLFHLIQHTLRSLIIQTKNKSLYLEYNIAETTIQYLQGDPLRLRQIFTNIINNAIKFTEQGGITFSVRPISLDTFVFPPGKHLRNTQGQTILFTIQDTGVGIPLEQQSLIFEPFYGSSNLNKKKYVGTGLGLSICRQLLDMMGGAIWVESKVGVGSTFYFAVCFPIGNSKLVKNEKTKQFAMIQPTRCLKILLAEDNPVNAQITSRLLTKLGHLPFVVSNGKEAIEKLNAEPYDLVLMDIEMPEMDGLEATQLIRKGLAGTKNQKIPILGITAHTFTEIYEKCYMSGMNDFILRPINLSDLNNLIQQYTNTTSLKIVSDSDFDILGHISQEILDIPGALGRLYGDRQLLRDVFQNFLNYFPDRMEQLTTAVNKGNFEDIAFHAHAVKGTTSQIGARTCTLLAIALEEAAKNKTMREIPHLMEQLVQEIKKVSQILKKF